MEVNIYIMLIIYKSSQQLIEIFHNLHFHCELIGILSESVNLIISIYLLINLNYNRGNYMGYCSISDCRLPITYCLNVTIDSDTNTYSI